MYVTDARPWLSMVCVDAEDAAAAVSGMDAVMDAACASDTPSDTSSRRLTVAGIKNFQTLFISRYHVWGERFIPERGIATNESNESNLKWK